MLYTPKRRIQKVFALFLHMAEIITFHTTIILFIHSYHFSITNPHITCNCSDNQDVLSASAFIAGVIQGRDKFLHLKMLASASKMLYLPQHCQCSANQGLLTAHLLLNIYKFVLIIQTPPPTHDVITTKDMTVTHLRH